MKISMFLIVFLVYLVANYYIFHRIWTAMPANNITLRIILIALAIVVVGSLFLTFGIGEVLPISVTSVLYTIGSSWLFILIYFVMVFAFQDLIMLANKAFHFMPTNIAQQFSKDNIVGLFFTLGFIALLMFGGYLRYTWKDRVYLPIQLSKPIGDSIQSPLKVVAISDLHLGYTIGNGELEKWVSLINKEKPDIILIAGDLVDNNLRPVLDANMAETLKKLDAPMGVYACLGNHEYIGNPDQRENIDFYKKAGINLLRDDFAEVDEKFYIVGRDDRTNSNRKPLSELMQGIDKNKPIILLDHQPYHLEEAEQNGIDLQISGHTHKGQVWPISMITSWLYEIDHGHLQKGDTHIYVSSGMGIWGGKFRIGTKSEFVVIDINKNKTHE